MTRAVDPTPDDTACDDAAGLLTIDQLAARSGISVRTIRFYAGKGLLPPPRLRGRLGIYGPDHLARLELVSELSALGFTLAAIEGYLTRLLTPADNEAMALQRALLVPWVPERLEQLSRAELDRRAGRALRPDELEALEALGVIERQPGDDTDTVVLHGAASLAAACESLEIGLPIEALRHSHEIIAKHTTALAEELMALFQEEVLQPYRDRGRPASERAGLREAFTRLKPITVQGVVAAFGRAVNRTIRERFAAEDT
ncbi:MAG: MerR family transcriptional regulator [Actinomycetota bacterium]|nr:MerR family transcriptional regulator [Actinomycetota bacterium]